MIDLRRVTSRDFYPIHFPPIGRTAEEKEKWRKTAIVFQFRNGEYIIWAIAEHRVLAERWFRFTLKRAIKELETEGWIIELDNWRY